MHSLVVCSAKDIEVKGSQMPFFWEEWRAGFTGSEGAGATQ